MLHPENHNFPAHYCLHWLEQVELNSELFNFKSDYRLEASRGGSREGMWGMHTPSAIFNIVFDEYNFSITSNLFDTNNRYALSTHKSKMCEQNASYRYFVKHSELGAKNLNKVCHKSCLKNTEMAITVGKFSKTR